MGLCKTLNFFHLATIGRLFLGVVTGVSLNATALLAAETASKRLRGAVFGVLTMVFSLGAIAAFAVSLPELMVVFKFPK